MLVREVGIRAASGGFGEYEAVRGDSEPVDYADWQRDCDYDLHEIVDGASLAAPSEDIRGRIRNEPHRVFAAWDGARFVGYVGIDEIEAE